MKSEENRLSWNLSGDNTDLWTDIRRMIYNSSMEGDIKQTKNHLHLLLDDMFPLIKEETFKLIEKNLSEATTIDGVRKAKRELYKAMKDEADVYHYKVDKKPKMLGVFDR